jgi:hypothetical protein
MTDRATAYIVTLDDDYRMGDSVDGFPTDADAILHAIRMIKGVYTVTPVVAEWRDAMAEEKARHKLRQEMREVLWS